MGTQPASCLKIGYQGQTVTNDVGFLSRLTVEDCSKACQDNPTCTHWQYNGGCWMFSSDQVYLTDPDDKEELADDSNFIVGMRECRDCKSAKLSFSKQLLIGAKLAQK